MEGDQGQCGSPRERRFGADIVSAKLDRRALKMADSERRTMSRTLISLDVSIGQLQALADRTGREVNGVQPVKAGT